MSELERPTRPLVERLDVARLELGVGVFVVRKGEFLVGRRGPACNEGRGLWALPGGLVRPGESIASAAVREVYEETGLMCTVIAPAGTDGVLAEPVLWVTDLRSLPAFMAGARLARLSLWVACHAPSTGEPERKEPDKCLEWRWVDFYDLVRLAPDWQVINSRQYAWLPFRQFIHFVGPLLKQYSE